MRSHSRSLSAVALVLFTCTSFGCLHHELNNSKGFVYPSLPQAAVPVSAAAFWLNGGGIHGLGSGAYLWPMPVSPALSEEIEGLMERWKKQGVPVLGPIKGEFAPIFCMDPPSEKDMYETLPPIPHGVPFVCEVQRKNVRFSLEKLVDQVDECRFFPLAGPCQLHHCHFKCTLWWDEVKTSGWPIPWTNTEHKQEVVYIDKDHLHRCGEPGNLAPAGGAGTIQQY